MDKKKKEKKGKEEQIESVNWEDVAKRAMADLDNYKKQAEKDKFEMLNIMKAGSLVKFMEVYDDYRRAMDALTAFKMHNEEDMEAMKNTMRGMLNIGKKFEDVFTSEGLEKIKYEEGDDFNPEFAEAISYEESKVGQDKVIETLEVGLKYKDRIIKPAKVRVGK